MNSENCETSHPYYSMVKMKNLKRSGKMMSYQILACTTRVKIYKSHTKGKIKKYQVQCRKKNLNHLIDCTLYQIFKIISNILYHQKT